MTSPRDESLRPTSRRSLVRALRALPARDLALLVAALPLVVGIRAALWLLPSPVIVRTVHRFASRPMRVVEHRAAPPRVIWAVEAVSRRVPHASCLTQALAAMILLRREGHPSRLRLGVARADDGGIRAHAWLEADGRVLIGGGGVQEYTPLPELERAPRSVRRATNP